MDPATLAQITVALKTIAHIVDALGVGGLIALALAGPLIMLIAILLLSYWHGLKHAAVLDAYRNDAAKQFDRHRERTDEILEKYDEALGRVTRYYEDNVILVRSIESIAQNFQDIIVSNTRALARLHESVRANSFCPIVRKESGQ